MHVTAQDLADALSQGAEPGQPDLNAATQGPWLNFRHPGLEAAYCQAEYERNRRFIAAGCAAVALVVACFFWLDPMLAPESALKAIRIVRELVGLPSMVLLVVGTAVCRRAERWFVWCAVCSASYMSSQAILLILLGPASLQYLSYGVWQGLIAMFFIAGLTFRWAAATGAFSCAVFGAATVIARAEPTAVISYFAVDAFIVYAFCCIATFRYERAARRQFVTQGLADIAYRKRLSAEADRRRWLEVIAAFLRHELKNAMTGVSSSIEMATRTNHDARVQPYFERARRSIDYMRRLLHQVAEATSLETALRNQDSERVDMSELVAERMRDHRQAHPDRLFDVHTDGGVLVLGSADALLQMLDKMVDNALEHGDPACAISVGLHALPERCRIVISDQGDSLPADVELIFQPFVSMKAAGERGGGGNLGLGLFVARTIAAHHGGTLLAQPLSTGKGAAFTIDLPRVVAFSPAPSDSPAHAPSGSGRSPDRPAETRPVSP